MNVIYFSKHMRPDAMDQLADEQTRAVRRKHDNAHTSLGPIRRPSVIPLDNSLLTRAWRAWKWLCINLWRK